MARDTLVDPQKLSELLGAYSREDSVVRREFFRNEVVSLLGPMINFIILSNGWIAFREDLFNTSVLVLLDWALPRYSKGRGSPFNFFFTCALNACRDYLTVNNNGHAVTDFCDIAFSDNFPSRLSARDITEKAVSALGTKVYSAQFVFSGKSLDAYKYITKHVALLLRDRKSIRRKLMLEFNLSRRDVDFILDFVMIWLRIYAYGVDRKACAYKEVLAYS